MSVVGDRYAESLFDLAKEENQVTQYLDDIKLVGEVLDSDPQIVQFFNHVLIENDKKIQLLDQSFKGNVDQYVLNFLKLLVQSRRIRYIDDIVKLAKDANLRKLCYTSKKYKPQILVAILKRTKEVAHHIAKHRQVFVLMNNIEQRRVILVNKHNNGFARLVIDSLYEIYQSVVGICRMFDNAVS